jgi:hypothetical protein
MNMFTNLCCNKITVLAKVSRSCGMGTLTVKSWHLNRFQVRISKSHRARKARVRSSLVDFI